MTSILWFHAAHPARRTCHSMIGSLCVQCLGVQHATEAVGREDFCDLCAAFQPRVHRNRLNRAMGIDAQFPTVEPSAALRAPPPLLQILQSTSQEIPCAQAPVPTPRSCSPSPQMRRVKHSRQTRDIIYLKEQMAQVLDLLSRQQAHTAPVEVPARLPPASASAPVSPMGAQAELELQPLMVEEDK
ncbi:UNVERIFIED_CONTAM: hypothetical protein FKN15_067067 [Acipenser sinensis]